MNIITEPTTESESEGKMTKKVLTVAFAKDDQHMLLSKYSMWKTLRIISWIKCFISNYRKPAKKKITAPITTSEINEQKLQLIYLAQQLGQKSDHFANQRESLNLQKNSVAVYKHECRDCILYLSQENHCMWRRSCRCASSNNSW